MWRPLSFHAMRAERIIVMSCAVVTPSEVSTRKQAAAIAELNRNGIQVELPTTPDRPAMVVVPAQPKPRPKRRTFHDPEAPVNPAFPLRIDLAPEFSVDALGTVATVRTHARAEGVIPPAKEFKSAPEAVEIPKAEIQNFAPLRPSDAWAVYEAIKEATQSWGEWPEDDARWGLTPHELAKLPQDKLHARHLKTV